MSHKRKSWLSGQMSVVVLLLLLLYTNLLSATSNSSNTTTDTKQEKLATLHIIAIVPTVDGIDNTKPSPSEWEQQGEMILSGAYQAAHEIGNSIHGYRFEVIPVRVLQCDLNEGTVPFVEELTSKENRIIGIVGYFCHNIAQHFSEILQHAETSAVQISATSLNGDRVPHIHHSILPVSESTAKALVQLILSLGWSKVAIISSQKVNFLDAKYAFLKEANRHGIKVISQLEINHKPHLNLKDYRDEIQNTGAKIIVGFLPLYKVIDVLCTAYHHGFRWPHYAWIFADLTIVDETPNNFQHCSQSTAIDALIFNGAIFLDLHPGNEFNYTAHPYGSLESFHFRRNSQYASVLYDSVVAIVRALNRSIHTLNERNLSLASVNNRAVWSQSRREIMEVLEKQLLQLWFQGATGFLNFSHGAAAMQVSVKLGQFQDQQLVPIGSYNFSLNQLILNETIMGEIPTDTLDRIYILYPTYLTVLLLMMICMCFTMMVLSMCLYFYYHKHPSIKATSTTLSLCLFIGCFFLLLSSFFHTFNSGIIHDQHKMRMSYRIFICMFDIYLINIGTDTVLATVIAKTLRIYHIFKKFGKVHQICSDQGLFILIAAIVSVKIILLIFWSCLDVSLLVDKEQYMKQSVPPYFLVTQKCENQYPTVWITFQYIYTLVLAFIMVLVAVLTRKIKRGNFKDTKKINMLVVVLVFDLGIFLPLWAILRLIDYTILSKVAYSVGITLAAFFSQVFLILPKIVPLVINDYRCLKTLKTYASTSYSAFIKTMDSEVVSNS